MKRPWFRNDFKLFGYGDPKEENQVFVYVLIALIAGTAVYIISIFGQ